ncbi:MAG: division/cell wall cluster transcriptional repressor MraZ [Rhodospirillaceae bacterium]|jgi:MraZ protein|nr:division/cell wall cluster transcriptional repressor MraZ [Rhodospirillaceae bacterium]MBT5840983.1 division/cell wall cluster transcriptional repressor MraZ [Rhodospirillaceae bacterium]MBT7232825.1 division/cell wall cluster transcriptional repressor MraZ [Rhodospirillaceae bacterium]
MREAKMAALFGRHVNKIDRKGRVSVPKPFRDAMTDQQFTGVHVFPSFKYAAIEALTEAFFNRVVGSLDNLDLFSDDQDDLATIVENTHALPYDTEGRVILPKSLLEHANLTSEAAFVGRGGRFLIWEPGAYDRQRNRAFERARARGATLPLNSSGGDGGDV